MASWQKPLLTGDNRGFLIKIVQKATDQYVLFSQALAVGQDIYLIIYRKSVIYS